MLVGVKHIPHQPLLAWEEFGEIHIWARDGIPEPGHDEVEKTLPLHARGRTPHTRHKAHWARDQSSEEGNRFPATIQQPHNNHPATPLHVTLPSGFLASNIALSVESWTGDIRGGLCSQGSGSEGATVGGGPLPGWFMLGARGLLTYIRPDLGRDF